MTKTAWIFGDSHAAGSGMYPGRFDDFENEYTQSYPCLIARDLGYSATKNYSMPGYSNDSMFRWVLENINDMEKDDLVMLCWSELSRTEWYSTPHQQWLNFTRGDKHYIGWSKIKPNEFGLNGIQQFKTEPIDDHNNEDLYRLRELWNQRLDHHILPMQLNFIKNVVATNEILKQKTTNIMNIWSLVNTRESPNGIPDNYGREKIFKSTHWPVGLTVFRSWALEQGFAEDQYEHLPWEAHRAFADFVVDSINKSHKLR